MNHQDIIVASSEVQMYLTLSNGTCLSIDTGTELSYTFSQNIQEVFAIGATDPVGIKKANATYAANLSLQEGEQQTLIDAINATLPATEQIAAMHQLAPFSISWSYAMKGLATPRTVVYTLLNAMVQEQGGSVNRNDVETIGSLSLRGTGVQRNIVPLV